MGLATHVSTRSFPPRSSRRTSLEGENTPEKQHGLFHDATVRQCVVCLARLTGWFCVYQSGISWKAASTRKTAAGTALYPVNSVIANIKIFAASVNAPWLSTPAVGSLRRVPRIRSLSWSESSANGPVQFFYCRDDLLQCDGEYFVFCCKLFSIRYCYESVQIPMYVINWYHACPLSTRISSLQMARCL